MQTSRFLARLMGPFLVAIGAGLLLNTDAFRLMAEEFLKSHALIFLSGLITLVAGLAIVNVHNVWSADWRVLITVFGWLGVIGGAFRIVSPQATAAAGSAMLAHTAWVVGAWVVVLGLGLWLSYAGYVENPSRRPPPRATAKRSTRRR